MISGVIDMYQKDPDTNIDNPEEFSKYNIWLQRKHKDNKIQTIITQNTTAQLDGGPNSHIFANINIFRYIHPDKCSVQIWNGSKDPEKRYWPSYHKNTKSRSLLHFGQHTIFQKNPQHTISQTALKHYNQFRSVIKESFRRFQFTLYLENKIKVETDTQHRYQQIQYFIPTISIKVGKYPTLELDITNISMDPIIDIVSLKLPLHGSSSIVSSFILPTVWWNQCAKIKPLLGSQNIVQIKKCHAMHYLIYSKNDNFT